jgi:hypothetical protein
VLLPKRGGGCDAKATQPGLYDCCCDDLANTKCGWDAATAMGVLHVGVDEASDTLPWPETTRQFPSNTLQLCQHAKRKQR